MPQGRDSLADSPVPSSTSPTPFSDSLFLVSIYPSFHLSIHPPAHLSVKDPFLGIARHGVLGAANRAVTDPWLRRSYSLEVSRDRHQTSEPNRDRIANAGKCWQGNREPCKEYWCLMEILWVEGCLRTVPARCGAVWLSAGRLQLKVPERQILRVQRVLTSVL